MRTVHNPVLDLPARAALVSIAEPSRAALRGVLQDLRVQARALADAAWARGKGPMACYWKAVSVYAGHIARAIPKPAAPLPAPRGKTYTVYYRLTVTALVEADSYEEACELKYDNVPYPEVDGAWVLEADCDSAEVEEDEEEEEG